MTLQDAAVITVSADSAMASASAQGRHGAVTRIAIVDDHPMMCSGLAMTLRSEPDFEVVTTGTSVADAIRIAEQFTLDLMIIDLDLGRESGLEAVRQIAMSNPSIRTLVFTAHDDLLQTHRAFEAGARGFLAKGVSARELGATVRAIVDGARFVTLSQPKGERARSVVTTVQQDSELSEREARILSAIAEGKTNKQIATELNVPERTIRSHVANVLHKLNLKRRILAAIVAVRRWR
jgi:DNA-binding NarL/FixJ family response regulator